MSITLKIYLSLPIVQPSRVGGEGESIPHSAIRASLISQSRSCARILDGCQGIAMETSWPGTFRAKATMTTLGPTFLYIIVPVMMEMCAVQGQHFISYSAFSTT